MPRTAPSRTDAVFLRGGAPLRRIRFLEWSRFRTANRCPLRLKTLRALAKHRNVAERLIAKLEQYAEMPEALASAVAELKGSTAKRLRVGNFRIVFEETADEIIVTKIGPRGSIHED